MDILKIAVDWAKAEIFSSMFFIAFGIIFLFACICLWQLGKTDLAKAYIIPTLIAGIVLMTIGTGLVISNKWRIAHFPLPYNDNASAFLQSEMSRVEQTLKEYKVQVFTAIPLIIIVLAILIICTHTATWRAASITAIAVLIVILLVDGMAHSRLMSYKEKLLQQEKEWGGSE